MTDEFRVLTERLSADLPVAVDRLTAAQQELAADRTERREFEKLVRVALRVGATVVAGLAALVLVCVLMLSNIIQGRATTRAGIKSTADIAGQTKALAERIEDCTTAGHECYDAGAQRTADAVAAITRQGALTTIEIRKCAYRPETEFAACIAERLPDLSKPATP